MKKLFLSLSFIILITTCLSYLSAKEISNEALPDYILEKIDHIEQVKLNYSLLNDISFGENCQKGDWNCIFYLSLVHDTCFIPILTAARKIEKNIQQSFENYVFKISNINLIAVCVTHLNPDIVIDEITNEAELKDEPETIKKIVQELVSNAKKIATDHINKNPLSQNEIDGILEIVAIRNHDQLNDYFCLKQHKPFLGEKSEKSYQACLLSVQKVFVEVSAHQCSESAVSGLKGVNDFSNLSHSNRVKYMTERNFIFSKNYSSCYINLIKKYS